MSKKAAKCIERPLLLDEMERLRNEEEAKGLMRFFKTGPGQYGEGDRFLGVRVPVTRRVVKRLWRQTSLKDLETCIASPWHEVRLAALLALTEIFKHEKEGSKAREECIRFYLHHTRFVNNWDLVDLSCYELLGRWLLDKDRTILYKLAQEGTLWEQRIAIVSTMQFLRNRQTQDTYALANLLMNHPHDLIHKAVGWLLREAGKRNVEELKTYLDKHYAQMPRTTLRYAIERLTETERKAYLSRGRKEKRSTENHRL